MPLYIAMRAEAGICRRPCHPSNAGCNPAVYSRPPPWEYDPTTGGIMADPLQKMAYRCACCGETYSGSPSFAFLKPCYYFDVPEAERDTRIQIDTDLCHIRAPETPGPDDEDQDIHAIRITLEVPIHGADEPFYWGVWVTQSEENFWRYVKTYDDDQSDIVTFGWLPVTMKPYNRSAPGEPFESLACDVHWGAPGQRPTIVLHETDHPLYIDQRDGISWDRAVAIAQTYLKTIH